MRLHDPEDAEALHDFRVGVRRLRTFLTAYRKTLDAGDKCLAGLKKLSKSTNETRDLEVGLAWLEERRADMPARHRVGVDWWIERLQEQTAGAYGAVRTAIPPRWAKVESRLRRRLSFAAEQAPQPQSFGQVSAELVRLAADRLESGLERIGRLEDAEPSHEARIHAKRLRYLIEPFRGGVPRAKAAVRALRGLQDVFGDLNDVQVILPRIRDAARRAAGERALRLFDLALDPATGPALLRSARARDECAGLLALAGAAVERRRALFATITERYLAGRASGILADVRKIADSLAAVERTPLHVVRSDPGADAGAQRSDDPGDGGGDADPPEGRIGPRPEPAGGD